MPSREDLKGLRFGVPRELDQRLDGPPFAGPNGGFVYYTLADTSGRIIAR